MNPVTIEEDHGRTTRFVGAELASLSTDNGGKPQFTNVTVWRTRGGAYVVLRETVYRVRHAGERCPRALPDLFRPATEEDTFVCPACGGGDWGQERRVSVFIHATPAELVAGFAVNGNHSSFSQALLADVSDADADVAAEWLERIVP